jgi:5-methyltetrahydropteroyltriglutamate--homocysteine methyltransferase
VYIKTNVLGYPRIGKKRELKKACEAYWVGKINRNELENTARNLRRENWNLLQKASIDLIPSNDFSYYDTTLDLTLTFGAIPSRYNSLKEVRIS